MAQADCTLAARGGSCWRSGAAEGATGVHPSACSGSRCTNAHCSSLTGLPSSTVTMTFCGRQLPSPELPGAIGTPAANARPQRRCVLQVLPHFRHVWPLQGEQWARCLPTARTVKLAPKC